MCALDISIDVDQLLIAESITAGSIVLLLSSMMIIGVMIPIWWRIVLDVDIITSVRNQSITLRRGMGVTREDDQ